MACLVGGGKKNYNNVLVCRMSLFNSFAMQLKKHNKTNKKQAALLYNNQIYIKTGHFQLFRLQLSVQNEGDFEQANAQ